MLGWAHCASWHRKAQDDRGVRRLWSAPPYRRQRALRSLSVQVHSSQSGFLAGLDDIIRSFASPPLWITLGWYDFTLRYRRTYFGPLWELLVVGVWIAGLGVLFGKLLGAGDDYLVYLSVGVILWSYISSTLTTGAAVFVSNARAISSINNPLFTYVLRNGVEHWAKMAVHSVLLIGVLAWSGVQIGWQTLLAAPGLMLLLLGSMWAVPLLGFAGARYRDLTHLIRAGMRFLFFATPVFWYAHGLGDRDFLALVNPFTHYLEIVRAPLMGETAPMLSWSIVLAIDAIGLMLFAATYSPLRRRLAIWIG